MKTLFTILFTALTMAVQAQGTVQSITISPANPTSTDTIYVYAALEFAYGACELDNSSETVINQSVYLSAHHCVGMLTVICPTVDTFKIAPLAAGQYNVNFTLTSGSGPAPCTPGIIPDVDSSFNLSVEPAPSGINETSLQKFNIYPNPAQSQITIDWPSDIPNHATIDIYNLAGQRLISQPFEKNVVFNLSPGLYAIQIREGKTVLGLKKFSVLD